MPILRSDAIPSRDLVEQATEWLKAGGVVLLPTETFYGLAVDPRQAPAVASVFDLKGRPADQALPIVAASVAQVEAACGALRASSRRLADRFWPGPLALLLTPLVPLASGVAGGDGTVAVRVPAHEIPRRIAGAVGLLTATSANRSGQPPATTIEELAMFSADPRVLTIDGGPTAGGLPSTIVDARADPIRLVRDGAVPWSRVLESLH